jgi:putative chitobiose transport system permease protein
LYKTVPTKTLFGLLALPLLSLLIIFVLPMGQALWMSGLDYTHSLYAPEWVGLGNYTNVISSLDFQQALWNTFGLLAYVLPSVLLFSTLMALAFAGQYRGMMTARLLVYLPVVVSMVVAGMLWKWLLAESGLVNSVLGSLHLPIVPWLSSTEWVLPAVAIVIVWKAAAYYMMMLITRLESIPATLYQAAELDGASKLQQLWHITLPQLKGMLGLVVMICTLGTLKAFGEIYVLTGGGPIGASKTLIFFIYERAFQRLDLGTAAAAGVLFAMTIIVLTLVQRWVFPAEKKGASNHA